MKAKESQQSDIILSIERMLFAVNQSIGDWTTAEPHFHTALTLAEQLSDYNTQAMLLTRAGLHYLNIGDAEATLNVAEKSWKVLGDYHGSVEFRHLTALAFWAAYQMLGSPLEGIRWLELVAGQFENQNYSVTGVLYGAMVLSFVYLGQLEEAEAAFDRAKHWPGYPPNALHLLHAGEALLVQHRRKPMPKKIEFFEGVPPPELGRALLSWAAVLPPTEALAMIERALGLGTNRTIPTVTIAAYTRQAQKLLALGKTKEALKAIQNALPHIQTYKLLVVDPAEVHFTHYQILKELGKSEAEEALEGAQAWIQRVADQLPEAYRESFLENNPVSKGVLESSSKSSLQKVTT
jgi:tetratricopeptide (TPR) repeat protein